MRGSNNSDLKGLGDQALYPSAKGVQSLAPAFSVAEIAALLDRCFFTNAALKVLVAVVDCAMFDRVC